MSTDWQIDVNQLMNNAFMLAFMLIITKVMLGVVEEPKLVSVPERPARQRQELLMLTAPHGIYGRHEEGEVLLDQSLYDEVVREIESEVASGFSLYEGEVSLLKAQSRTVLNLARAHKNLEATNLAIHILEPLWEALKRMKASLSLYEYGWSEYYLHELRAKLFSLAAGRAHKYKRKVML